MHVQAQKKVTELFILHTTNPFGQDAKEEEEEEEEEEESDTEVGEDSRGLGATFQPLSHHCPPIQC